jgi:hypothetical protein
MSEKIISFGVTMDEFQNIQKEARQKNMSISMYCKSLIVSGTKFIKFYNHLIKKLESFPLHITFTIRDIMGNELWENIPKGIKLSIGRQFYSQVNSRIIENIKIEGYGAAKTMRYSKKK